VCIVSYFVCSSGIVDKALLYTHYLKMQGYCWNIIDCMIFMSYLLPAWACYAVLHFCNILWTNE